MSYADAKKRLKSLYEARSGFVDCGTNISDIDVDEVHELIMMVYDRVLECFVKLDGSMDIHLYNRNLDICTKYAEIGSAPPRDILDKIGL